MSELCRLCGEDRPLAVSHILPAFVFKWKRSSAAGSPMRNTKNPNQRVQDGLKLPFLCEECEELFSKDEREFANKIFYPFAENPGLQVRYGPSLLRFCASVSWRVIRYALENENFDGWGDPDALALCRRAEQTWREFLLGERSHPGEFRQHLLPLHQIGSISGGESPYINRYLTRTIHLDLCYDSSLIFTFAKLGPLAIFGNVFQGTHRWRGTQIQANEGLFGAEEYTVPANLWPYFNRKARESADAMAGMSDKQREVMAQTFRKNIDDFAKSASFRALNADVRMFGNAAFSKEQGSEAEGGNPQGG